VVPRIPALWGRVFSLGAARFNQQRKVHGTVVRRDDRVTSDLSVSERQAFYARATTWVAPHVIHLRCETGPFEVSRGLPESTDGAGKIGSGCTKRLPKVPRSGMLESNSSCAAETCWSQTPCLRASAGHKPRVDRSTPVVELWATLCAAHQVARLCATRLGQPPRGMSLDLGQSIEPIPDHHRHCLRLGLQQYPLVL
jgi:hypothetical protein